MNFICPPEIWRAGMPSNMNVNKKILFLLTLNLVCFYTFQAVLGENSTGRNEGESTNEYKSDVMVESLSETETTETDGAGEDEGEVKKKIAELEKEKKELMELMNKFQEISGENKEDEEGKVESEDALSSEERGASPSVKEGIEMESEIALEDSEIGEEEGEIVIKEDEITNPFEVAENLYKMGGYEKAIDIYNLINKEDIDNEKATWIAYQIANCYRKLGALDKALKIYNKIQDEYGNAYWGEQAQWYIDEIKWRTGVQEKLEIVGGK
jgi:tetratricopeptide (TPR) repeat protein